ncbi:MAG TPA: hypothetical protein DCR63_02560 [Microbacterium sp.]|nr:hypothetical protein [Microbacterium sp.]
MAHSDSSPLAGPTGTMLALVGAESSDAMATLEGIPGVETLTLRDSDPETAARRIAACGTPWIVHDADPLEHVAAAWVELYEERATLGTLEVEVETALAHFEEGTALMPDYYIVLDPDAAEHTWRHWWCGALGFRAPRRVLPAVSPTTRRDTAIRRMLTSLPTSRPWPEPGSWLPGLAFEIPDRVGLRDRAGDAGMA